MNLGNVAEATGDLDDAYDQFMASFDMLRRQHRHQVGPLAGIAALNLANILAGRGESEKAFEFLAVGVRNAQAFPSSYTLLATAMVASASGHREAALVLHGAASAYLVGAAAGETSTRLLRNDLEALRADGSLGVDDLYESGRRCRRTRPSASRSNSWPGTPGRTRQTRRSTAGNRSSRDRGASGPPVWCRRLRSAPQGRFRRSQQVPNCPKYAGQMGCNFRTVKWVGTRCYALRPNCWLFRWLFSSLAGRRIRRF